MENIKEKFNTIKNKVDNLVSKISKHDYLIILAIKLLLDIAMFILFINNNGKGIYNLDFNVLKYYYSNIAIVSLVYLLKKYEKSIAKFYLELFVIIAFLPISTLFAFCNKDFLLYTIFFGMFIFMIVFSLTNKMFKFDFSKMKIPIIEKINFKNILLLTFILSAFITYFLVIYYNGLPGLSALRIYSVYSLRAEFYLPKYIFYLFDIEYKFIVPFLISYFFSQKKYKLSISFFILQFLFYLSSGHKSILFIIPLLLVILVCSKHKNFNGYFKVGVCVGIFSCIAFYFINRTGFDIFIRRFMFVPANLKFVHYDFFSINPKLGLLGTVFFKYLNIHNPYSIVSYQNAICGYFLNNYNETCNTGFLIEGFDRFGYIGFLIIAIIFIIFLRFLNNFEKKYGFSFTIAISLMPLVLLNEGFLISGLFVHEYAVLIITLVFFRMGGKDDKKELNKN